MSPFFCGYTTFHPQVCPLLLVGMSLFTLEFINFHSWVRHLSLARIISSSRGYVTFRSRFRFATTHLWACHLSTVQPRICPNIPVISSFAIKHSFLCLVVYCFHLLMSIMFFFSHASLTNVTKKWSASNCDLKTPSRAARIWNPKFECNEAWNPSNGKSLRSWPQP